MINKLKKLASGFRNKHGYGNLEAIELESLLIKLNVITLFRPLSGNLSGMAIKTEGHCFMLINNQHSIGRQHFSICHELYHLYFDENFTPHHSVAGGFDKKTNEYHADVFASYFLMPDDGILNLIPNDELKKDKISLSTILKIEHYFNCSRRALLFRLKELGIITGKAFDSFVERIKVGARQHGYSTKLYESGNTGLVIGDFGSKSRKLFEEEKISEGHYIELLGSIGVDILNNGKHEH